ncbi:MAG TPA: hypothetical protein VMR50_18955 [Myxococcota bacterium]|nr:hypothetical protein [Myxococcota bacterium]
MVPHPFAQWLLWEEQANFSGFRTTTEAVALEVADVPRAELCVEIAPDAPRELQARFADAERVRFPRHPLNRDTTVTYSDRPAAHLWSARFTSSRTLVIADPGARPFALKLATSHPHHGVSQPEKTRLRTEVVEALQFAAHVRAVDARLGRERELIVLLESIGVRVRDGETGFLVRDLAPLCDGQLYLPAFSIPFVGRALAAHAGREFAAFWADAYAEPVGRAKARLLARYGLQYVTPNPQNILVQLDRALRPTGAIVFRDLADTDFVTDSAEACGAPFTRVTAKLAPETANSFWAFDEAPDSPADPETLAHWYRRHDRAYLDELRRQRGLHRCAALEELAREVARAA